MRKIFTLICALAFYTIGFGQVILQESFETTLRPPGWAVINAGSGNDWIRIANATLQTNNIVTTPAGNFTAGYQWNTASAANAWLITRKISMTAGTNYQISFIYAVASASFPERLRVTIGSDTVVATQTTVLWVNGQAGSTGPASLTNTTFQTANISYTPTVSGDYCIGFNCFSAADQYLLLMDAVTVTQINTCSGAPTGGTASANPAIVCGSTSTTVSVNGSTVASNLTFQWQSSPVGANNWTNVAGATNATLTATPTASIDYRRITTCPTSSQSANSAPVTVIRQTPPANDLICDAPALTRNGVFSCANTTCATATPLSDAAFTSSVANNTVWYKFTPTTTGPVEIRFKRPSGVTTGLLNGWAVLMTNTGFCPDATAARIGGADSVNFNLTVQDSVTFTTPSLSAGTEYLIYIDGFSGSFGQFCIGLPAPPAGIPTCSTPVEPTTGATFSTTPVTVRYTRSSLATSYDFFLSTDGGTTYNLLGSIPDTVGSLTLANSGTYFWYVVPRNILGTAAGCQASARSFIVLAPTNDSCGAPIGIGSNGAILGTNVLANQSLAASVCDGSTTNQVRDVWYRFTPNSSGAAEIRVVPTAGSALDPIVELYTGTATTNCAGLTQVTCRDTYISDTIKTNLTSGVTYLVRVYGFGAGAAPAPTGAFTIQVNGIVLPVALDKFQGERRNSVNMLSWTTSQEVNNKGFEIQRSADGRSFSKIGFVEAQGNGNSSLPLSYAFNDERVGSATAYYRLQQQDKDGRSSLSSVVKIEGLRNTKIQLTNVFPNPVKDVVTVTLNSPDAAKLQLVITDVNGRVVMNAAHQLVAGDNAIRLNTQQLSTGTYLLKAIAADGTVTNSKTLVKQ